jgi:hypothetical protein
MGVFAAGLRLVRALVPSARVYAHSALWYVPYIDNIYDFEIAQTKALGIPPPPKITKSYMSRINKGAINAIEETQ